MTNVTFMAHRAAEHPPRARTSHFSMRTARQTAGLAGSELGIETLNRMLSAPDQAKRLGVLHDALTTLKVMGHYKSTSGGFAAALVNSLERGLGLSK